MSAPTFHTYVHSFIKYYKALFLIFSLAKISCKVEKNTNCYRSNDTGNAS